MQIPKINISRILKQHLTLVKIYPKSTFTKSDSYDPFRKEEVNNYNKIGHNYIPLKAYVRYPSGEGLILREIGLKSIDAREIWISEKYIQLIKNSERIVIDNEDYTVWNKAVGSKLQIFRKKGIDWIEILIFKKEI